MSDIQKKKAFLFDLNGTMVNDMDYHIVAWHDILNSLGANITMQRMKEEAYGKNEEVIDRIMPGRFSLEEKRKMSFEKEKVYQAAFKPKLGLIPGLYTFLQNAHHHQIPMAIGSAAINFNIDFVIDNLKLRSLFAAIVSADDVTISKPDPQTYLMCAEKLHVNPADCIVFEDAPKGVESAKNAGMKAVVITTMHEAHEFEQYDNVLMFIEDYTDQRLISLL